MSDKTQITAEQLIDIIKESPSVATEVARQVLIDLVGQTKGFTRPVFLTFDGNTSDQIGREVAYSAHDVSSPAGDTKLYDITDSCIIHSNSQPDGWMAWIHFDHDNLFTLPGSSAHIVFDPKQGLVDTHQTFADFQRAKTPIPTADGPA